MVPVATKSPASLPMISAARCSSRFIVGSSPYTSSPTSASAIARRIAAVGRVTVSLRRSIVLFNADKLLENFVLQQHSPIGQPQHSAVQFQQAREQETPDRLIKSLPLLGFRTHAFSQPQPHEKLLLRPVRLRRRRSYRLGALPSVHVFHRRLNVLRPRRAVERMRVRTKPRIRLQPPVLQIMQRFKTRPCEV